MARLLRILGSLTIAVPLLIVIAAVLAWGTIYETRFGTAAVQQFIYQAWWFQALLVFLAVNLTVSALERWPWQRRHVPFLLAHLGIIMILIGGILGGHLGIDGQLIIPEGESAKTLQLSRNVLVIEDPATQQAVTLPTRFETTAWVHERHEFFQVPLKERPIRLVVTRYYPDAAVEEHIEGDGPAENPAAHLVFTQDDDPHDLWLLARDPERFGARWGEAHVFFLEPQTAEEVQQLVAPAPPNPKDRGVVVIEFPDLKLRRELPVQETLGEALPVEGTPYRVTFKQYFTDLAITDHGIVNQSDTPNNPAVAFLISGPEGEQPFLAFSLHPDFQTMHEQPKVIHAHVTYRRADTTRLPPHAVCLVRPPTGPLFWLMTGAPGEQQQFPFNLGSKVRHPWLGFECAATEYFPKAKIVQTFTPRGNDVRAEALHVMLQDGESTAEGWLTLRRPVEFMVGGRTVTVTYAPAQRDVPVSIKLLDFRKIDYPGTQMAWGFESDIQLTDPERGLTMTRTISMNNPLKYRGFSFFQSSYVPGSTETTILSVRNDPGMPLVYGGFLIVIGGVVALFTTRRGLATSTPGASS